MPTFEVEANGKTYEVDAPDMKSAASALSAIKPVQPVGVGEDIAKSAAVGVAKGPIAGAGSLGDVQSGMRSFGDWIGDKIGLQRLPPEQAAKLRAWDAPGSSVIQRGVEGYTGEFYKPQTSQGKIAEAVTSTVANPVSYIGPGSAALKIGGATLAGAGSEVAGQAAEGTKYEGPARLLGGLAGGVTAAKTLGPTIERAAIPTAQELKDAAVKGYDTARSSGLVLDPKGVGTWAQGVEQQLGSVGFTGGKNGTAPKTLGALGELQAPPAGATIGPSNIDTIRRTLGEIAKDVQPTAGGAIKPTSDAAAATKALEHLKSYTENIPAGHIVAGDAAAYARATKEANANYAAGSRAQDFDARLTKAERATDRQVAGSLDSQIKAKAGQILDRGARGLSAEEKAQLELINSGTAVSNIMRQLGRGGAGVIPLGTHAAAAAMTGGGSIPASLAIGLPLYAARKGAEAMTKSRAQALVEMLAKRSPEYERRAALAPPADPSPGIAAVMRAMLAR